LFVVCADKIGANNVQTTLRRHGATGLAALLLAAEARNNRVVTNYACACLPPHGAFTLLAGQLAPQGSFIQRGSIRALAVNWSGLLRSLEVLLAIARPPQLLR